MSDQPTSEERLRLTRRGALKVGALSAGAVALGCSPYAGGALHVDVAHLAGTAAEADGPAPDLSAPVSVNFPLGVASGLTLAGGALAWTRYFGGRATRLDVWRDDTNTLVARETFDAPSTTNGTFSHIDLPPLFPGVRHRYAWFEIDREGTVIGRSEVGTVRGPADADNDSIVTLAATGCTEYGVPFDAVERMGERTDVDCAIILGDNIYSDDAEGLSGIRGLWHNTLATEGYRAVRRAQPVLAIWDDHEVENGFNPEQTDPQRIADGLRAFWEHQPMARFSDTPDRLYRRQRFGRTVEVFLLDCRSERWPSTQGTPEERMLSPAQMGWIKDALSSSVARFKLIVTGMPIGIIPVPLGDDRWPGYESQRQELLAFVEDNIDGALFLTGDVHMPWTGRVANFGVGETLIEVGAGCGAKELVNPLAPLFAPPQYDWAGGVNNYATLRFDPTRGTVTVTHHDAADVVLHEIEYDV